MRKIALALAILGTSLLPMLYTAPAHAQATRTWVSGVGDDANPCSRTAPCKTFPGAITKTANGGEINCLDPGGFGSVTITKSITIDCRYTSNGGVLNAGVNGIVVSAGPTDKIQLIGLEIDGAGSGVNGVLVNSGLIVVIQDCLIRNQATNGVSVNSSTTGTRVFIKDTTIINNGTTGNANQGGVTVASTGSGTSNVFLSNVTVFANQNYGVQVTGGSNSAAFLRTVVTPTGIVSVNSGALASVGPSNFFNSGAPNQPLAAYQ